MLQDGDTHPHTYVCSYVKDLGTKLAVAQASGGDASTDVACLEEVQRLVKDVVRGLATLVTPAAAFVQGPVCWTAHIRLHGATMRCQSMSQGVADMGLHEWLVAAPWYCTRVCSTQCIASTTCLILVPALLILTLYGCVALQTMLIIRLIVLKPIETRKCILGSWQHLGGTAVNEVLRSVIVSAVPLLDWVVAWN